MYVFTRALLLDVVLPNSDSVSGRLVVSPVVCLGSVYGLHRGKGGLELTGKQGVIGHKTPL